MQQARPDDLFEDLGHGITAIDTGFVRPRFDAAYLIVHAGRAAYVDTGTNDALPRLLGALARQGLEAADVDYLIVTHVHLDHAGAAGSLMRELPNAKLVVHPRGAPHMIDPSALVKGASAVYGDEEVARTYGVVQPVPADRVLATHDGMTLDLAGRPLHFIDAPGHARHHHGIWDEASRGWFTGDCFGISYPEFASAHDRLVIPTTTPVQFDPVAMKHTIGRLLERNPARMYLTHYGCIDTPSSFGAQLLEQVDAMVAIARAAGGADRHASLREHLGRLYRQRWRERGSTLDDAAMDALITVDVELNAQGLGVWLDRPAKASA
ncbi:MAG TPA: MBL fold metallo-hydrolase [Methylibium sp.]|uniref:MBL fold metallo-hydrolase n=1 Tax=Methylibium sp. TaxID=2067992 RepID=UPI002DB8BFB9|nr:MBL fold metallo-hydrolase [Methylibium sp.]HEU4457560.1 MBL fold metallo-hydrolase [Methylibium sp.]